MPARRRGQEPARARRHAERLEMDRRAAQSRHDRARALADDEDRVWAEHQAYEAYRRAPETLDEVVRRQQRREQVWADVQRALRVVEADFARWRAEAQA